MTLLSAGDSAHLANTVYLRNVPGGLSLEDLEGRLNSSLKGPQVTVVRSAKNGAVGLLDATTGIPLLGSRSGFSILLERSGGGVKDHVLVCRGSMGAKWTSDWLSNYNVGFAAGPNGVRSHLGFNKVFKSMLKDLSGAVKAAGNIKTLHIVGHSLGGAVSTLFASHFKSQSTDVRLYTFGAPRAIDTVSSISLSKRIGRENIKRVYSRCDPVPMVPVFPFSHLNHCDHELADNRTIISGDAHDMLNNYLPNLRDGDWPRHKESLEMFTTDYWLDLADTASSKPFSALSAWAINNAIKSLITLVVGGLQTVFLPAFTLLDRLAAVLFYAIDLGKRIGEAALRLMRIIAKYVGITIVITEKISTVIIRYLISRFLAGLANMAATALRQFG